MIKFQRVCLRAVVASLITVIVVLLCYLSFARNSWMLVAETRVLNDADLNADGVKVELRGLDGSPAEKLIRVVSNSQQSDFHFEYVSVGLSSRKLTSNELRMFAKNGTRPRLSDIQVSHDLTSVFRIRTGELEKAVITISYRRHRYFKLFGSDIMRYWVAISDFKQMNTNAVYKQ